MPIAVVCPSCKAEFKVSEKFAGKQGPCPKCKAPITIPAAPAGPAAAAAPPEVKIHAPDPADAPAGKGKAKTSPGSLKPLVRQETKLRPAAIVGMVVVIAAVVAGAWFGANFLKGMLIVRVAALLVVSIPTAAAGYMFLRDDELEPYRGGALWLRSSICALIYTALWCGFFFIPPDLSGSAMNWFFLAPPFALLGAGVAFASYDLDFGSGFFHYCFYLLVSLGLGAAAGLQMPWTGVKI
jgi:hypothetical protein